MGSEAPDLFEILSTRRGWTPDYLEHIEYVREETLLDMDHMVARLHEAYVSQSLVVIAPDFDMDGISSGVLGYAGLSELGFNVRLHVPDYRLGHDLVPEVVARIHTQWPDTKVMLTCDNGVNSHEGIAAAKALGWTTLVTDHHTELEPGSQADVTVNPCRLDETFSFSGICGAHVLLQVLLAYTKAHQPEKMWEVGLLRLFAGLGTVSDVMPLLHSNRQLVRDSLSIARLLHVHAPRTIPGRYGELEPDPDAIVPGEATLLQVLNLDVDSHHPVFVRAFLGFATLLKAFSQAGKLRDDLLEDFYAFYVAPAMNHPRRIGSSLEPCFEVFTAEDPERMLTAAHKVIEGNELRKALVIENMAELTEGSQPFAPWVYFSSAYGGMFGLLASKLMEMHGHPVVVLGYPSTTDTLLGGSARAPEWFEVITTLADKPGLSAIGHQQACGVRVEHPDLLPSLVDALAQGTAEAAAAIVSDGPVGDLILGPDPDCDADLTDTAPLVDVVRRLEALRPFGHGFTYPDVQFALEPLGLRVDQIGSEKQHLRIVPRTGISCLWWNQTDDRLLELQALIDQAIAENRTVRVLGNLQLNMFRGETRAQLIVNDLLGLAQG